MKEVTVASLRDRLIFEFIENRRSENTKESYRRDIKCFFDFIVTYFPDIDHPQLIDGIHCTSYNKYLKEVKKYSPKTIQRRLAGVSKFFVFLQLKKMMVSNPLALVERDKGVTKTPTEALEDEEVVMVKEEALKVSDSNPYALGVLILIATGIRREEVLSVRYSDFYAHNGKNYLRVVGKGGKEVVKLIPNWLMQKIDLFYELHCIEKDSYLLVSKKKSGVVQCNSVGIWRYINKVISELGINKRISPHSFRATYITNAISHNFDLHKIQADVGHTDIKTTMGYNKRVKRIDDSPVSAIPYLRDE